MLKFGLANQTAQLAGSVWLASALQFVSQLSQRLLASMIGVQQLPLLVFAQGTERRGLAPQVRPPLEHAAAAFTRDGVKAGDVGWKVFTDDLDLGIECIPAPATGDVSIIMLRSMIAPFGFV